MEQGTRRFSGRRELTGQAEDYVKPVLSVMFEMQLLLTEYAAKGGDLNNVSMWTSLQRDPGRVSRTHLVVELKGFGTWADGSTAADASGTSSPTPT